MFCGEQPGGDSAPPFGKFSSAGPGVPAAAAPSALEQGFEGPAWAGAPRGAERGLGVCLRRWRASGVAVAEPPGAAPGTCPGLGGMAGADRGAVPRRAALSPLRAARSLLLAALLRGGKRGGRGVVAIALELSWVKPFKLAVRFPPRLSVG